MTNSYMRGSTTIDLLKTYKGRARSQYTGTGLESAAFSDVRYAHHFPLFQQSIIPLMLKDSRIRFGLNLIKGPITLQTRFFTTKQAEDPNVSKAISEQDLYFAFQVKGDSDEHEEMLIDMYNRFWLGGLEAALKAIEWGYSGSQTHYTRLPDGKLTFDKLEYYSPSRTRAVSSGGLFTGLYLMDIKKYIPSPKCFWHVHSRQLNRFYGVSILEGAHVPWHEMWTYGGARDIRRLWYFKNAFDSGLMRYPVGTTTDESGNVVNNLTLAVEMMDQRMAGAYFVLPATRDSEGNYEWEYEPPTSPVAPSGLLEYPDKLDKEKLEGMGIPPEVVESEGSNGLGSATGRKIPYIAFISTLFPLVLNLLSDVNAQIIKPICTINKDNPVHTLVPIIPQSEQVQDQFEDAGPASN